MKPTLKRCALLVTVALLVVLGLAAASPSSRYAVARTIGLGQWGFRSLLTADDKVALINARRDVKVGFGLGCGGEFIPYSEETVFFCPDDPVELRLTIGKHDAGPLECLGDGLFSYVSSAYPIRVFVQVLDIQPDQNNGFVTTVQVWAEAAESDAG